MRRKWLFIPVISVSFMLLLTLGFFLNAEPQSKVSTPPLSSTQSDVLDALNYASISVAKNLTPSVVNISTLLTAEKSSGSRRGADPFDDPFWDDLFKRFFDETPQRQPRQAPRPRPQGSGFIVKEDGYILTNNHVIKDAEEIKVTLSDNREFKAKLIGTDKETEVALIKIDAKGLPAVKLGNSEKLQVGELVWAIGNPFGLSHSVTNGIVSATGRSNVLSASTVTYQDFIQTDAAINPGNSGGPLVNIRGEVIGINTAIATASGVRGNIGIGFAIPIDMALDVMNQLMDKGKVVRGWLGISFQYVDRDIAEKYGLDEPVGALIVKLADPAKKAGLEIGDLILEFNGQKVKDGDHLKKLVAAAKPDDTVDIKVIRGKEKKDFKVKLTERTDEAIAVLSGEASAPSTMGEKWMGLTVQELTEELAKQFGYDDQKGVLISDVDPDGPAAKIDSPPMPGDLIQEVERKQINNMKDFRQEIKNVENPDKVLVKLRRATGTPWYVVLKK